MTARDHVGVYLRHGIRIDPVLLDPGIRLCRAGLKRADPDPLCCDVRRHLPMFAPWYLADCSPRRGPGDNVVVSAGEIRRPSGDSVTAPDRPVARDPDEVLEFRIEWPNTVSGTKIPGTMTLLRPGDRHE